MTAVPGGGSSTAGSFLQSDVQRLLTSPAPCTVTQPCATIFSDSGTASFRLSLMDLGAAAAPASPSANNDVTLNRYHVSYRRSDGRNTPGVDVPYAFDGAATVTVPSGTTASVGFELVRHAAKLESPLAKLMCAGFVRAMVRPGRAPAASPSAVGRTRSRG